MLQQNSKRLWSRLWNRRGKVFSHPDQVPIVLPSQAQNLCVIRFLSKSNMSILRRQLLMSARDHLRNIKANHLHLHRPQPLRETMRLLRSRKRRKSPVSPLPFHPLASILEPFTSSLSLLPKRLSQPTYSHLGRRSSWRSIPPQDQPSSVIIEIISCEPFHLACE